MSFFFEVFYRPIANLFVWLMEVVGTNDIVLGILLLVIVAKVVLLPVAIKNKKAQIQMKPVAEKIKKIKETAKDKKTQTEMVLKMYQEEKINPFTPLFLLLLQIPVFLTIFFVLKDLGEKSDTFLTSLYSEGYLISGFDFFFLSFDLSLEGGILIAILVGVSQFILMYEVQKNITTTIAKGQKAFFTIVLPVLVGVFSFFFIGTVGVYWLLNNCISILQEIIILNKIKKPTS